MVLFEDPPRPTPRNQGHSEASACTPQGLCWLPTTPLGLSRLSCPRRGPPPTSPGLSRPPAPLIHVWHPQWPSWYHSHLSRERGGGLVGGGGGDEDLGGYSGAKSSGIAHMLPSTLTRNSHPHSHLSVFLLGRQGRVPGLEGEGGGHSCRSSQPPRPLLLPAPGSRSSVALSLSSHLGSKGKFEGWGTGILALGIGTLLQGQDPAGGRERGIFHKDRG